MKKKLMIFFLIFALMLSFNFTKFSNVTFAESYEYAWFPVSVMDITQIAYETASHGDSNHIDCIGASYAFAPFTGKIVKVSPNYGVTLFQSNNKVYYPDGTLDYMTVQFMHGSNYTELKEWCDAGTTIPQGTDFYQMGAVGAVSKHYDIGVYKGITNSFGSPYYRFFGNTYAFNAFYINSNKTTSIINKGILNPINTVNNNAPTNWSNLWVNRVPSNNISVTYQTYDDVNKQWLPNVVDTQDYAGIYGHDVDCIYANLSSGNITYKVHYKGGSWLSEVTNRSDYAGIMGKPIDGLMMKTDTGKTIHYKVHLRTTGTWLPYVTGYNQYDSNNGYAGTFGQEIDAIQIYLD